MFFLQETEAVETYHQASLYRSQELVSHYPVRRKLERNKKIIAQYKAGISITMLAQQFGISSQRIHQIISE